MQFKKYSEIPEKHRFDLEVLLEAQNNWGEFCRNSPNFAKINSNEGPTIW